MKVGEFLDSRAIVVDLKATNKKEVLEELIEVLVSVYHELNREQMVHALLEREKLGSTGIGDGVAIPHGKLAGLKQLISCFGKSDKGVEFQSMDKKPAHLFFLLFAPENSAGIHLKALARISRLLKRPSFRKELLKAESEQEIYETLTREDDQ
jgi:PTS system nitrogen regulatory IIA component